jgi:hypothetical protein
MTNKIYNFNSNIKQASSVRSNPCYIYIYIGAICVLLDCLYNSAEYGSYLMSYVPSTGSYDELGNNYIE